MIREIIILSRCVKRLKGNSAALNYEFHFKGVYRGEKIKKIMVLDKLSAGMSIDHEYLLKIKFITISGNILYGELLEYKNLDNVYVDL